MADSTAACARGRSGPSRSRTQGEALGGTKGEPEDAEMRRYSRVIRVRGVVGPVISLSGRGQSADAPVGAAGGRELAHYARERRQDRREDHARGVEHAPPVR